MPATEKWQCFSKPYFHSEMEHIKLLSRQCLGERPWRGFLPHFPLTLLKEVNTSLCIHDWWRLLLSHQKKKLLSWLHVQSLEGQFAHQLLSFFFFFLWAITVFTVNPGKLKGRLYIVAYPWSLLQQRMVDCAWSTCYINRVWSLKDKNRAWIILYHTSSTFNISIWC